MTPPASLESLWTLLALPQRVYLLAALRPRSRMDALLGRSVLQAELQAEPHLHALLRLRLLRRPLVLHAGRPL